MSVQKSSRVQHAAAKLARMHSHGATPDPEDVLQARQELLAARLEAQVLKHLSTEPGITYAQKQHIADVLLSSV